MYTFNYASDNKVGSIQKGSMTIPLCESNVDYQEFLIWNAKQNVPMDINSTYVPTQEEFAIKRKEEIITAVQNHMDTTAQSRNYDNIHTLASYADSIDEIFKTEGTAGRVWRDEVWVTCRQILLDVEAGERVMPTVADVLAELPKIEW